jgi:hypothetical protein
MTRVVPAGEGFPVARCTLCKRDVLAHLVIDARDEERRCCIHCDAELDPLEIRWLPEAELPGLGYSDSGAVGTEGCGRPGCGSGRCGS